MDYSIRILWQAAIEERRIGVITPEGLLPGYLIGLDATHMVLYAWFRKSGEDGVWAIIVVPRSMVALIDDVWLKDEPGTVRENYYGVAKPFLDGIRTKISGEDNE